MALTLLAVSTFMNAEVRASRWAVSVAAAMPLGRPDVAVVFSLVLPFAWGLRPLWGRSGRGWVPGLALAEHGAVMWAVTGHPEMNGGAAKILWLAPELHLGRAVLLAVQGAVICLAGLWNMAPAPAWLAGAGCVMAGGLWWLAAAAVTRRSPADVVAVRFALLAAVGAAMEGAVFGPALATAQFARYLTPYVPLVLVAAARGATVARRAPRRVRRHGRSAFQVAFNAVGQGQAGRHLTGGQHRRDRGRRHTGGDGQEVGQRRGVPASRRRRR